MRDQLESWVAQCGEDMHRRFVVGKFVSAVETFIANCPVKTGRTLNSFRATLNEPPTNTDPGPGEHDKSGSEVLEQARQVAESAAFGDTLHFGSDYVGAIVAEEGNRGVKPHRMIMATVNAWGDE